MSAALTETVALVTGASRGAGRGIALALAEQGATVYVTGRTTRAGPKPSDNAPGAIEDTAQEVTALGGTGIAVQADHTDASQVESLFARIDREQGRLDVLANAAWGGNEYFRQLKWGQPFWEQPLEGWDQMITAGAYSCLLASRLAAMRMARQRSGLIVHVLDGIGVPYRGQMFWDLGHELINRMVAAMSGDLKKRGVAVIGLNPGFMRTERVQMHLSTDELKKTFGYDRSETPQYLGRAVAALAADPQRLKKTGELLWVADLAVEYGFTDIDGKLVPRFEPPAG
jgi:NAD(P)-dependent dehydrogenase (short-subunit alcohol dehydrogenase family)